MPEPGLQEKPEFIYALKRLNVIATVLHLGAHPDDEDSGLLVYVSRKLGGRAVYWSATRGEGGQNSVNAYRNEALGLYRTWESLAARAVDEGECLFGPFVDFGYSKTAQDAFANWGRHNVLREIVRAVRLVQPQIIVSRWSGMPEDGHGHHQAIGEAAAEAFDAAGDPNCFPELLGDGLVPWQPLRLFRSTSGLQHLMNAGRGASGSSSSTPSPKRDDVLTIGCGEFDPVDGRTLQERAWEAINCHQTQGMAFTPSPGEYYYHFFLLKDLLAPSAGTSEVFSGFDPTLTGVADLLRGLPVTSHAQVWLADREPGMRDTLEIVKHRVREAIDLVRPFDPLPAAAPLLDGLSMLRGVQEDLKDGLSRHDTTERYADGALWEYCLQAAISILKRKETEFEKVIAHCLGLRLQCLCTRRKLTPGESLWMSVRLWNHRNLTIDRADFSVLVPRYWQAMPAEDIGNDGDSQVHAAAYEVFAGDDAELSCPYWLEVPRDGNVYVWPQGDVAQQPLNPAPLQVECRVEMGDRWITLRGLAVHRKGFPGGYRVLPPAVVPPISLHPETQRKYLLSGAAGQDLELRLVARCNDDERPAEGELSVRAPAGWHTSPSTMTVRLAQGGGAQTCSFLARIPPATPEGRYELSYTIRCRDRDYGDILTPVRRSAPGLPATEDENTCTREDFILSPSTVTVHVIRAQHITGLSCAYIEGSKEELVDILARMGVAFRLLSDHDLAHTDLTLFDTIVVGPNAYVLRHSLRENAFRLLEYVRKGGNLVVQYQRYEYEGHGLAPYPIRYHRPHDRVTDQSAPVAVLRPQSGLFRFPNAIGTGDFDGWCHDRGLYFPRQWDDHYVTYLSCGDPGEVPSEGGLLGCRLGEGNYTYVGYSLFSQIQEGVPGAFRLFFNMLALGHCENDS